MKHAGRNMPAWAAKNSVWGRGKGPIPGCPIETNTPSGLTVEDPDVPEPPEPFTRVPEPEAGL